MTVLNTTKTYHFKKITSTQDVIKQIINIEHPKKTPSNPVAIGIEFVVSAQEQTAGYGRFKNRVWHSPLCENLYVTIALNEKINLAYIGHLPFLIFDAIINMLQDFMHEDIINKICVKWPNDFLFQGKKFCGILCERWKPSFSENVYYLIGVGMNLSWCPAGGTKLSEILSEEIDRQKILKLLMQNIQNSIQFYKNSGFAPIKNQWLKFAWKLNEVIKITEGQHQTTQGKLVDIADDGALLLKTENNTEIKIYCGNII